MKRMNPRCLLIVILLVAQPQLLQAQSGDSITFVTADWTKEKIGRGLTWKSNRFKGDLFSSNQNINILEVRKRGKWKTSIGFEARQLKPASQFGTASNAVAALNGTFFNMKDGGSVDFIKAGGAIINENQLNEQRRGMHQKAALAIKSGKLRVEKWNGENRWEHLLDADEIMVSGPLLIFHSQLEAMDSTSFALTRHPRTVVAESDKLILFITIDGRHENAAGMSLMEVQLIMRWLATISALNLDGGGSTTLWIRGKGVVNYPSDNKRWDHEGERPVANVLLIKR